MVCEFGRRCGRIARGRSPAVKLRATGLAAWWVQRVSAPYMLLFILFLLASLLLHPRDSYAEWRGWVDHPGMTIAIFSFFAALLSHMWVGLRDVLIDYARPASLRLFMLWVVGVALLGMAAWVFWILLRTQR
ncbi:succinate dehydrogenase, hydrophobic membrane anchor protein [Hydrogenophaga sp. IBVHS1]|uniref:succinate dehydrogenase, hydrophobic membrane anchor protein n=1 Tax=unclassified Hydrogenophaga TaxID=2610897 RepID=UPI00117ACBB8|nr:succinate dehydrogenase, hydrophobic membrane anchor protein [Hydrogenophaga sp. IBVHS1]